MTRTVGRWQFWIDRGGTFTDIVARHADGRQVVRKLLSEDPERYQDAALHGIRQILGVDPDAPLPTQRIASIRMGTTVGTNALLERRGERTVLLTTHGFGDALRIGYQNRPDLFALHIQRPDLLYERVIEVRERVAADGQVIVRLEPESVRPRLEAAYRDGMRSAAIVLLHSYRYPDHERILARLAAEVGFPQVSASHEVSPLMKLVGRGDTTVVDAYLSPLLRRYVRLVRAGLDHEDASARLLFMQSNGGLTSAHTFRGKDSILSGPAGGLVGAVAAASMAGLREIITFDMGGTSTDVAHYAGELERSFETEVAGVRLRAPMLHIHTVAAGGGSVLHYDGTRLSVGPDSAGADPGPACYRRGGPLTVTDCNVMLGKIQPDYFPRVFGRTGDLPLDTEAVKARFAALSKRVSEGAGGIRTPHQVAEDFLAVAVENMAAAIKRISVQRGYHLAGYTLVCFGGAGGQHACKVADALGIARIFMHPLAGVLSAYGMGLAAQRTIRERAIEAPLVADLQKVLDEAVDELANAVRCELLDQGIALDDIRVVPRVHLRYQGTDTALLVEHAAPSVMAAAFRESHRHRFGFADDKPLVVEAVSVEAVGVVEPVADPVLPARAPFLPEPDERVQLYTEGELREAPLFRRPTLAPGCRLRGPAVVIESGATVVIEPGWEAEVSPRDHLLLARVAPLPSRVAVGTEVDPLWLEVFNKRFMSIAEQMGYTLANTAHSVNIKERLDFSCAVFDGTGQLIANAPHIPVHLGSMGAAVQALMQQQGDRIRPGDVYLLNSPYRGGTHLPDITVITPVFEHGNDPPMFYLASRGHHADIGGITPGSMPPSSRHIDEEGKLSEGMKIVQNGRFLEAEVMAWLTAEPFPARDPCQNIADLRAQIAANERGVQDLRRLVDSYSLATVRAYMQHVQDNAEESVRRVLDKLGDGEYRYAMDNGAVIQVRITVDRRARRARVDFAGTSPQQPNNFNAPAAVCRAAVLYVFRTLVQADIPLNAGCLKPLEIVIPDDSLLNPTYPAAVAGGNVETSQYIVDALYGALGVLAASQGTMNNLTFGNDRWQYYETICGGSGAGPTFDGTDAVHTHMTNSRITDPEVLEWRFPVRLEAFQIRRGSGGGGAHRGGDGVIRRIRFLEPMTAGILSSHRVLPPFGLQGGAPGACGRNSLNRAGGATVDLGGLAQVDVRRGDQLVIETPGGGGFGAVPCDAASSVGR